MQYAAIALVFAIGCGDDSQAVAVDAAPARDASADGSSADGGPDLAFDDQWVGTGGEVSAAVAPDGTMVVAWCGSGLEWVHGDARTLTFSSAASLSPDNCDPTVAFSGSTFYLADDCRLNSGAGICLRVSTNMGHSWSQEQIVDSQPMLVDRPWVFATPGGGAVITWGRYPDLANNVGYTFAADVAPDGMLTNTTMLTNGNPACTSMPGVVDVLGDVFAIGNLATDLQPATEHGLMYLWSRLEGTAWTQRMMPSPDGPTYAYPSITATPDGTLWVFYTDENSAVYLTKSTDHGETWSERVRVNPQSQTQHVILVWAAAGEDGVVRMTWYEREPTAIATWHVYFARSDTMNPVRVDSGPAFLGGNGEYGAQPGAWLGDFTAVVTDGVRDYVAYTAADGVHVAASRRP